MTEATGVSKLGLLACEEGCDPIEDRLRASLRTTIEAVFDEELDAFLGRLKYSRLQGEVKGYRHGRRERQLTTTLGTERVRVPRARLQDASGRGSEWGSQALRAYQRRTKRVEALITSAYLAGANTRQVKKALFALFKGAVSKDVVSRAWRKVKGDWEAWRNRSLAEEDIVHLLLDGMVVKTRLDHKTTAISVLVALGVRRDGQKILLAVQHMAGESTAAWRQFLENLDARGLQQPVLVTIDGAPGLEAAVTALWGEDLPTQRCTLHKHRNLLAHAPKRLHEELNADYRDMIYAPTAAQVQERRTAFLRKWRLKCRAVADSLQEAGERLFSFIRLHPALWKAVRTTNAIEQLNREFRHRIKTQTLLPCAETVPMLFWALLASGQIQMRKVDGWAHLAQPIQPFTLDGAA
ncbi:MAG: IS256 family transposase [Synechococcus sp. SB0675_bin_7]|nr:IS256 family transposase [Synechococcus sp. SB0675_bin_7]